jgi:hypothetical protein
MIKKKWDVFISHASEDRDITDNIAKYLESFGIKIWYDNDILNIGDSLSKTIDNGLIHSRYGILILSENFLKKDWPEYEFRALLNREIGKKKVILPIWHGIKRKDVEKYSPFLLEKYALDSTKKNINQIVLELIKVIKPTIYKNIYREIIWRQLKNNAKIEYIDYKEIKPHDIRYNVLPKHLMLRLTNLHYSVFNILGLNFDEMIDNFKRDLHPHHEVAIWECIYLCFQEYNKEGKSFNDKNIIISQLLLFSLGINKKNDEIPENEFLILKEIGRTHV